MQQVVQIDLPVPLGIDIGRQVHTGQFPRQALLVFLADHRFVAVIGPRTVGLQNFQHPRRLFTLQRLAPPLIVHHGLRRHVFGRGNIEFAVQDRIPRRILIHIRRAVPDPLARDKDRQFHMQLDLAHLERGRMPVPHQVPDQPGIVLHAFGAFAIAHPRRLADRRIVAHVIDHPDKPVIQHRDRRVKVLFHTLTDNAQRLVRAGTQFFDLGLLFGGQRHPGDSLALWFLLGATIY